jgi:hypothetical protein
VMLVLEMSAWLQNNAEHVICIHQDDWYTTGPYFIIACLLAYTSRELFKSAVEA